MSALSKYILVAVLFMTFVTPVYGHVIAQDEGVKVLLHIDPGDNPIAGTPAVLHFDFLSNTIVPLEHCDCTVTVENNGATVFNKKITESEFEIASSTISLKYTFPSKGIYLFTVMGKGNNDSFTVPFTIRVEREGENITPAKVTGEFSHYFLHHLSHLIIFGGAFIVGGILWWRDRRKNTTIQS